MSRPMKILICGDRNWTNKYLIMITLADLPIQSTDVIIHGNARGADRLGAECALELKLAVVSISADWKQYGRAAGPIRNKKMLDEKPDLVLAFHNNIESSKGTKNCINEAKRRGITVKLITE